MRTHRGYDRSRILDAAARAEARRRRGKAIGLYRWVLAMEPHNGEIHHRVAPLLARTGQPFDAWLSFKAAARAFLHQGQPDKALAVYREAALLVPREAQVWQMIARLQARRGRKRDAVATLIEGSRHFRGRRLRPVAVQLLRRAREIDAWNYEAVLELAKLLASSGQLEEARILLDGLTGRHGGERLRRVRGAQLRLTPGPRQLVLWVRALLGRSPEPVRTPTAASSVVPLRRRALRAR
jgi:tetratricopeptide (TPR) repeat protein